MKPIYHGNLDFGIGFHSTSHIEALWAEIKKEFNKIYGLVPMSNFIYFLREIEMRIILKKFSDIEKLNRFGGVIKKVYIKCNFKFSTKVELKNFINYD